MVEILPNLPVEGYNFMGTVYNGYFFIYIILETYMSFMVSKEV